MTVAPHSAQASPDLVHTGGLSFLFVYTAGSYVDTLEGEYNHAIKVSTRMENTADSGGANTGFR